MMGRCRHALDRFGDEIVVLGRLVGDAHAIEGAELPGPHAGAIDHEFGLDVALGGGHPRGTAVPGGDTGDRHVLDDLHALLTRPFGQGHGGVHGIDAPVLL